MFTYSQLHRENLGVKTYYKPNWYVPAAILTGAALWAGVFFILSHMAGCSK